LWATFDRDGLYQVIAQVAVTPTDTQGDVSQRKLGELLPGNPVYLALDDATLVASATMLDHGVTWLPIVRSQDDLRPVGRLRGDRISRRLMEKLTHQQADHAQIGG
jgi:hypothetical protein